MGNSLLLPHWSNLKSQLPATSPPGASDPCSLTSSESYRQYTVTAVLAPDCYEARDVRNGVYWLRGYQVAEFEQVKRIQRFVDFLRENREALQAEEILDVIVEPASSDSWILVVATTPHDSVPLSVYLQCLSTCSFPADSVPYLALEDIFSAFASLLGYLCIVHQHGYVMGRLRPENLLLVRRGEEVQWMFDYLQPESLGLLRPSDAECEVTSAPEGGSPTPAKDIWDLGVSLLTVTLIQVLQQRVVTAPISDSVIKALRTPLILKEYISILLRPVENRPGPGEVLQGRNFTFLRKLLHGECPEALSVWQLPAAVLALAFRRTDYKVKAATLMLDLIAKSPETSDEEVLHEVDLADFAELLNAIDLKQQSHLISPILKLLSSRFTSAESRLSFKRSALLRFVRWAVSAFPPTDRRFLQYLPNLLLFAIRADSNTVYEMLASSDIFPALNDNCTAEVNNFIVETCHRYGIQSLLIIPALADKEYLSTLSALDLLRKVPVHIYDFAKLESVARLLVNVLRDVGDSKEKFEVVTDFLAFVLQRQRLWSFISMKGMCFAMHISESPFLEHRSEQTFACADCMYTVCLSCLKAHATHNLLYRPNSVCQESNPANTPLFDSLEPAFARVPRVVNRATGANVIDNTSLLGPGDYDVQVAVEDVKEQPEQLLFYLEAMVEAGGDLDNLQVGLRTAGNTLLYCGQTGTIQLSGVRTMGPPLQANDVIGIGATSHSRVFFTFNGLLHPFISVFSDLSNGGTLTLTLDQSSVILILRREELLFKANLCSYQLLSVAKKFERSKLSAEFWSVYKKTRNKVKREVQKAKNGRGSLEIGKMFLSARDDGRHDSVADRRCKNCQLF